MYDLRPIRDPLLKSIARSLSIVSGVYSSSGRLGGSQLALVPIEAEIGRPQVYTAKVPIKLRARTAGSNLQRVIFFLSSEDGDPIDLQEERFDAAVLLQAIGSLRIRDGRPSFDVPTTGSRARIERDHLVAF